MKLVQDRLGHSTSRVTLDVYAQVMTEDRDGVADPSTISIRSSRKRSLWKPRRELMRYLVVAGLLTALAGCSDDPVEPLEQGPYEVTTLRTLPEGVDAISGDLNENGQALWHEDGQPILWNNGGVLEVPVGRFLGSSGEVVGDSSVWIEGQLTQLPGRTRGITEDGTIYLSRNDTMFTWRDGVLTATDRPLGQVVGPEGRIWDRRFVYDEGLEAYLRECGFFLDGEWHPVGGRDRPSCFVETVEENGWAIMHRGELEFVAPDMYPIVGNDGGYLDLAHVNSEGHAVAVIGILGKPDGTRIDLREHFEATVRLGAINDDGEILAQLDDRVVLLTPR